MNIRQQGGQIEGDRYRHGSDTRLIVEGECFEVCEGIESQFGSHIAYCFQIRRECPNPKPLTIAIRMYL